jgi:hypothetical protein
MNSIYSTESNAENIPLVIIIAEPPNEGTPE